MAAIIGSVAAGQGHAVGTSMALIRNPFCGLAIWFWVKSTKIACPHWGSGVPITFFLQTRLVGSTLLCPRYNNEFRKLVMNR
jgi:hypothetical protein